MVAGRRRRRRARRSPRLSPAPPFGSRAVLSQVDRGNSLATDPIALGIIGALAIGFVAAALFAIVGFIVSAAVSARERIAEFALLRALGLSSGQLSVWLSLENAALAAVSLVTGTALGLLIAWVVLPFITVTQGAATPYPPVIVEVPVDGHRPPRGGRPPRPGRDGRRAGHRPAQDRARGGPADERGLTVRLVAAVAAILRRLRAERGMAAPHLRGRRGHELRGRRGPAPVQPRGRRGPALRGGARDGGRAQLPVLERRPRAGRRRRPVRARRQPRRVDPRRGCRTRSTG